jgi:hypothetical protein
MEDVRGAREEDPDRSGTTASKRLQRVLTVGDWWREGEDNYSEVQAAARKLPQRVLTVGDWWREGEDYCSDSGSNPQPAASSSNAMARQKTVGDWWQEECKADLRRLEKPSPFRMRLSTVSSPEAAAASMHIHTRTTSDWWHEAASSMQRMHTRTSSDWWGEDMVEERAADEIRDTHCADQAKFVPAWGGCRQASSSNEAFVKDEIKNCAWEREVEASWEDKISRGVSHTTVRRASLSDWWQEKRKHEHALLAEIVSEAVEDNAAIIVVAYVDSAGTVTVKAYPPEPEPIFNIDMPWKNLWCELVNTLFCCKR